MRLLDKLTGHDLKKGMLLTLVGWFFLSTMYAVSKKIDSSTTIPTMLFFRNFLSIFLPLPWIIKHWPKSLNVQHVRFVFSRAIFGLLNLLFIFLAIERISLVNTTLLNNSAPFFVPLIVWFWLRLPVNVKIWPAILTGFIGIAVILNPDARIFNLGAMFGLLSGICLALNLVTMRLQAKSEKLYTVMFYFFTIGLILTAPIAAFNWKVEGFGTLVGLLSLGLFSALGQVFLFMGMQYAKAHQLAPLAYVSVIFAGLYEYLIWGEAPHKIAYFGMLLIIASGAWIVYIGRVPKK